MLVREVITNEEGHYVMDDVAPGGYWIMAHAEGFEPTGGPIEVPPGEVVEHDFFLVSAPPPPPPGACCFDSECVMLPEEICAAEGGDYMGDGTMCFPNPCVE